VSAYRRRAVQRHVAAGARSKKKQKFFSVCFEAFDGALRPPQLRNDAKRCQPGDSRALRPSASGESGVEKSGATRLFPP